MTERPELSERLRVVYDYVRERSPEKVGRREIADSLGISYYAARYRLDRLVDLGRLGVDKILTRTGRVYRVWYLPVYKFIHYTVVGNVDTRDPHTSLTASCTLDYDVNVDNEDDYYTEAVRMIYDWVTQMFNEREVKFSSQTSKTEPEIREQLIKSDDVVTDVYYDWWWRRTGRSRNDESDEGVITWKEAIPLGVSGGWFTPGRKR